MHITLFIDIFHTSNYKKKFDNYKNNLAFSFCWEKKKKKKALDKTRPLIVCPKKCAEQFFFFTRKDKTLFSLLNLQIFFLFLSFSTYRSYWSYTRHRSLPKPTHTPHVNAICATLTRPEPNSIFLWFQQNKAKDKTKPGKRKIMFISHCWHCCFFFVSIVQLSFFYDLFVREKNGNEPSWYLTLTRPHTYTQFGTRIQNEWQISSSDKKKGRYLIPHFIFNLILFTNCKFVFFL